MAKKPGQQLNTQKSGTVELKQRLLYVVLALLVFRFGSFVPVPGVNPSVLAKFLADQNNAITGMLNMFSGGALHRASILSLGIMPYISSSIIIQLFSTIHPALAELKKDGEHGRKMISQYTRYGTLLLALIQGFSVAIGLPALIPGLVTDPGVTFYLVAVTSLVTGTMFLMWLGEQITERGIGNGISLIIFVGIAANLPSSIGQLIMQARESSSSLSVIGMLFILLLMFGVIFFVVFMERGQRRIPVNYAKRQEGRKVFAAQSTHLPLKINMAGVIPAIFASSIILFPGMLSEFFGQQPGFGWLKNVSLALSAGQPLYLILYVIAIVFFSFFYTAMVFNPRETADNLKKSGAFIPGIRPGEQTSRFIDKVMTRLTLVGALYITFVCLVPQFITMAWQADLYLGGTSLLIAVVVIMDFMAQIQTLLMSQNYESVLKKANLKNYGR